MLLPYDGTRIMHKKKKKTNFKEVNLGYEIKNVGKTNIIEAPFYYKNHSKTSNITRNDLRTQYVLYLFLAEFGI